MSQPHTITKDKLSRATINFTNGTEIVVEYIRVDEYPDKINLWHKSSEGYTFMKSNINYIEWEDIPEEEKYKRF